MAAESNSEESADRIAARWTAELLSEVRGAASQAGFHLCGIARAEPSPASCDSGRFALWIEQGRAGEMEYLKRRDEDGRLLRSDLQVAIPWARSVIVCALNYASADPYSTDAAPAAAGWIGRYAWSGREEQVSGGSAPGAANKLQESWKRLPLRATDYHEELLSRLREVEARLLKAMPCQTRCYVDTGPIVERDFAARAGIGWIGKNTCVINQEQGSWLLLGVIVTSLPVARTAAMEIAPDRCGSCTRCIDACPTDALVAPREMDASRCIAYLTIEKKGAIAAEFRELMGRQVFGCDICQDVCPWNERARNQWHHSGNRQQQPDVTPGMEVRQELVNPPLAWLGAMDSSEFKRLFKRSPVERTGRRRLHRNVAIAMGNSGQSEFLPRLREWAAGEDPVLAEAAEWAIGRIGSASIGS
jgi:epoxyqueuosine reductase